jgi:hypothetical protein
MPKKAVSVTLERDNLLWLRGRAGASKRRSLSEALDGLVTEARLGGRVPRAAIRSVVGTVDISADDPWLERADAHVGAFFDASVTRPLGDDERPPRRGRRAGAGARRRRG